MILFVPAIALVVGIVVGWLINAPVNGPLANYLALCCLAAMDTIFGGTISCLENKFYADVFVTGFISNVLIAFSLAWIGDRIGLDLFLAIAVILGGRIFTNLSVIRRHLLARWQESRERKRVQEIPLVQ